MVGCRSKEDRLYIGQSKLAQGKKDEAKTIVTMRSEVPEKEYQGTILRANIYTSEGNYAEAELLLQTAITEESDTDIGRWLKLNLELASIYLKNNKNKEMIPIIIYLFIF